MFGKDDNFLNLFGGMIELLPALPVFGPQVKLQLVFADDVAEAVRVALEHPESHGGQIYELGGPEQLTMMEIHQRIAAAQGRKRRFIAMPDGLSATFAALPRYADEPRPVDAAEGGQCRFGRTPQLCRTGDRAAAIGAVPRQVDAALSQARALRRGQRAGQGALRPAFVARCWRHMLHCPETQKTRPGSRASFSRAAGTNQRRRKVGQAWRGEPRPPAAR